MLVILEVSYSDDIESDFVVVIEVEQFDFVVFLSFILQGFYQEGFDLFGGIRMCVYSDGGVENFLDNYFMGNRLICK